MAQVVQAPCPIASIATFHPDIPAELVTKLSLDLEVALNDDITPETVKHAEDIILLLDGSEAREVSITESVIQTAKDRLHALRDITSNSKFRNPLHVNAELTQIRESLTRLEEGQRDLQEGQQRFQESQQRFQESQQRFQESQQRLQEGQRRIEAHQENYIITRQNELMMRRNTGSTRFIALRKVNAGDGIALAQSLLPRSHNIVPDLQAMEVGEVLTDVIDTSGLTHAEVLRLVRFYRDDFGIQPADVLATRIQKITNYLTGLST